MGAHSTMEITRGDALDEILVVIRQASNEELENVLFSLFGDCTLHNFMIVKDYNSDWHWKHISGELSDAHLQKRREQRGTSHTLQE